MGDTQESWTLWVCTNCIHHHANGECGDCHNPDGHEGGEPLSKVDYPKSTIGLVRDEHSENCPNFRDRMDTYECDCETNTYSTSSCGGCGSDYHGERHAMTEWGN